MQPTLLGLECKIFDSGEEKPQTRCIEIADVIGQRYCSLNRSTNPRKMKILDELLKRDCSNQKSFLRSLLYPSFLVFLKERERERERENCFRFLRNGNGGRLKKKKKKKRKIDKTFDIPIL